jgi:hypothetical protein
MLVKPSTWFLPEGVLQRHHEMLSALTTNLWNKLKTLSTEGGYRIRSERIKLLLLNVN